MGRYDEAIEQCLKMLKVGRGAADVLSSSTTNGHQPRTRLILMQAYWLAADQLEKDSRFVRAWDYLVQSVVHFGILLTEARNSGGNEAVVLSLLQNCAEPWRLAGDALYQLAVKSPRIYRQKNVSEMNLVKVLEDLSGFMMKEADRDKIDERQQLLTDLGLLQLAEFCLRRAFAINRNSGRVLTDLGKIAFEIHCCQLRDDSFKNSNDSNSKGEQAELFLVHGVKLVMNSAADSGSAGGSEREAKAYGWIELAHYYHKSALLMSAGAAGAASIDEKRRNLLLTLARNSYAQAAKLDSGNGYARWAMGTIYLWLGRTELAHAAFNSAQAAEPTFPHSWAGQAGIARLVGQTEESRDLYRHAVTLDTKEYFSERYVFALMENMAFVGNGKGKLISEVLEARDSLDRLEFCLSFGVDFVEGKKSGHLSDGNFSDNCSLKDGHQGSSPAATKAVLNALRAELSNLHQNMAAKLKSSSDWIHGAAGSQSIIQSLLDVVQSNQGITDEGSQEERNAVGMIVQRIMDMKFDEEYILDALFTVLDLAMQSNEKGFQAAVARLFEAHPDGPDGAEKLMGKLENALRKPEHANQRRAVISRIRENLLGVGYDDIAEKESVESAGTAEKETGIRDQSAGDESLVAADEASSPALKQQSSFGWLSKTSSATASVAQILRKLLRVVNNDSAFYDHADGGLLDQQERRKFAQNLHENIFNISKESYERAVKGLI